jgi:hypothetical protein
MSRGARMLQGGFAFAEGTTYTGQIIVYGSHSSSAAAGLSPYLRHANEAHAGIQALRNPSVAAAANLTSKATGSAVILTVGANVLDFTLGENSQHGLLSTEFVATNTVDVGTGLGFPAAGAYIGTAFYPGIGSLIGAGIGAVADVVFKSSSGGAARNTAIGVVNGHYQKVSQLAGAFVNPSGNLTVYPDTSILPYVPNQIQSTYTYNRTVGLAVPPVPHTPGIR